MSVEKAGKKSSPFFFAFEFIFTRLIRKALSTTERELQAIAAHAMIGFKSKPRNGVYKILAALGTPRTL